MKKFVKHLKLAVYAGAILLSCLPPLRAQETKMPLSHRQFLRDTGYEQFLRVNASPDQILTPARVLRWLHTLFGAEAVKRPASLEFQPVVNAHDGRVCAVAQFAYKF